MNNKWRFHAPVLASLVILTMAGLAGCGPDTPGARQSQRRSELESVQKAFSRLSASKGLAAAFAKYAADDVVLLPAGHGMLQGHDTVVAALQSSDTGRVRWSGEAARVADSDDLGGTWGAYIAGGSDGASVRETVGYGKFLALWEKRDGDWRIVAFMANRSPGPGVE